MYVKEGLVFSASEGGLNIAVHEGPAENAPVIREIIFSKEDVDNLLTEIGPEPLPPLKSPKKRKKPQDGGQEEG